MPGVIVDKRAGPGSQGSAPAAASPLRERVAAALEDVIADAELRRPGQFDVLDAGCGHRSPLVPFKPRIRRLIGVDVHPPEQPLAYLDAFTTVDLCDARSELPGAAFDVVVSQFTLEHFTAPGVAIGHFHHALRPGGSLVLVTVNRRHPFVAAYLALPAGLRGRLQRTVKASPHDAHPLVGRCNDPATIRGALEAAGFERIELETIGNLARAWGRNRIGRVLGRLGDRLFDGRPTRRSTVIATARKPAPAL